MNWKKIYMWGFSITLAVAAACLIAMSFGAWGILYGVIGVAAFILFVYCVEKEG